MTTDNASTIIKEVKPKYLFGPPFQSCANHSFYYQYEKIVIFTTMGFVTAFSIFLNVLIYIGFVLKTKLRRLPCAKFIWHIMVPSDILTSLCIPFIIVWDTCGYYLPVAKEICVTFLIVSFIGSNVSKWSVAIVAMERFLAICWPLQHRRHFTKTVEHAVIVLTWLVVSTLVFIEIVVWPLAIGFYRAMPFAVCDSPVFRILLASTLHQIFGWYSLFIVTVVCYIGLGIVVVRSVIKMRKMTDHGDNKKRISDVYKTFRITSLVILSFALCWMPYQIIEFLNVLNIPYVVGKVNFRSILLFITYLNSLVNPITYFFMDIKYREVALDLLLCRSYRKNAANKIRLSKSNKSSDLSVKET